MYVHADIYVMNSNKGRYKNPLSITPIIYIITVFVFVTTYRSSLMILNKHFYLRHEILEVPIPEAGHHLSA